MDYPKYMRIDSIDKYDERKPLENYQVKEKLDGTNLRFHFPNAEEIILGSRNNMPLLDTQVKQYQKYLNWIDVKTLLGHFPDDYRNLIFFAEGKHKVYIDYQWTQETEDKYFVVGFDIYDMSTGKFREDWQELFEQIGIPTVEVYNGNLETRPYQEIINWVNEDKPKSMIDEVSDIEGVVFADYENQSFYKYRTEHFKETKQNASNKENDLIEDSQMNKFFNKYFTYNRVHKIVDKMEMGEYGYNPKNPLPTAFHLIVRDMIEEADTKDIEKMLLQYFIPAVSYQINMGTGFVGIKERILDLIE